MFYSYTMTIEQENMLDNEYLLIIIYLQKSASIQPGTIPPKSDLPACLTPSGQIKTYVHGPASICVPLPDVDGLFEARLA